MLHKMLQFLFVSPEENFYEEIDKYEPKHKKFRVPKVPDIEGATNFSPAVLTYLHLLEQLIKTIFTPSDPLVKRTKLIYWLIRDAHDNDFYNYNNYKMELDDGYDQWKYEYKHNRFSIEIHTGFEIINQASPQYGIYPKNITKTLTQWIIFYWHSGHNILEYIFITLKYTNKLFNETEILNAIRSVQYELDLSDDVLIKQWKYLKENC